MSQAEPQSLFVEPATKRDVLLAEIRTSHVPRHVAVIMDGNGRWASQRGLARWEGHRAGMRSVREVIEGAIEAGVEHLSLYAFSQENWERPKIEVAALMGLLEEYVEKERAELVEAGVRVSVFGELERLTEGARGAIRELERATRGGGKLHLHLAISYGSRAEVTRACRALATRCAEGRLAPEEITPQVLSRELYTADWPDPDLVVRTSGEYRISNFLLWQIAYAELYVTPILWPDFERIHLFEALLDFQRRERRFGRVGI
ncbi:MAG: polyprenyl diphosphate synthase [Gemmatimonadota bacterium]